MEGEQNDLLRQKERAEFLVEIARDLQASGVLPQNRLALREARVRLATHSYFALNDAYHRWRIEDGHNTQPPKIAALQCLCIMRIEPFGLVEPDNAQTISEARPNEIFALSVAAGILGFSVDDFSKEKLDQWLRILNLLSEVTCESIEPVIQDAAYEIKREIKEYNLVIFDVDKYKIDMLVTLFELLAENAKLKSNV